MLFPSVSSAIGDPRNGLLYGPGPVYNRSFSAGEVIKLHGNDAETASYLAFVCPTGPRELPFVAIANASAGEADDMVKWSTAEVGQTLIWEDRETLFFSDLGGLDLKDLSSISFQSHDSPTLDYINVSIRESARNPAPSEATTKLATWFAGRMTTRTPHLHRPNPHLAQPQVQVQKLL